MDGDIITMCLNALVVLIGAVVTRYVVPWLKARTTAQDRETVFVLIKALVSAAEQVADARGLDAEGKKEWVMARAREALRISEEELDALVEAMVREMRQVEASLHGDPMDGLTDEGVLKGIV